MDKRVLYMMNDILNIIIPSGEIEIEQVALKDVPAGVAYKIVDVDTIPTDRTYRNAWEIDMSEPDGYGIGHDAWAELHKEEEDDNN